MGTKKMFNCTCCSTVLDRLAHLERTMRVLKVRIKTLVDKAVDEADNTDEALKTAHAFLQLYKLRSAEHAALQSQVTCPKCGLLCDYETYRNVDSCYVCYGPLLSWPIDD